LRVLQVTAYEMMLEANRRPLHMAAANFLEELVRQCTDGDQVNARRLNESYFFEDDERAIRRNDDNADEANATSSPTDREDNSEAAETNDGDVGRRKRVVRIVERGKTPAFPGVAAKAPAAAMKAASRLNSIVFPTMSHNDMNALLARLSASSTVGDAELGDREEAPGRRARASMSPFQRRATGRESIAERRTGSRRGRLGGRQHGSYVDGDADDGGE
jgi:hypothetical protein